jgi:hypothetical protein
MPGICAVLSRSGIVRGAADSARRLELSGCGMRKRVVGRLEIAAEKARLDRRTADYLACLDASDAREPDDAPNAAADFVFPIRASDNEVKLPRGYRTHHEDHMSDRARLKGRTSAASATSRHMQCSKCGAYSISSSTALDNTPDRYQVPQKVCCTTSSGDGGRA